MQSVLIHPNVLSPLWNMNNMSFGDSIGSVNVNRNSVLKPTHTDVLLGRGVGTNRHAGNTNFRQMVSKYVRQYVTSTKAEKISITRGIVDRVQTQLNPPGRFLEKDQQTGNWKEVDMKRAHEKTAQALRDGAAPLRKRLSDEITSDPLFLLDVFDKGDKKNRSAKKSRKSVSPEHLSMPKNEQKVQAQDKPPSTGIPSPIFSSTSIDQLLSATEIPLISPSQSPVSSVDEFDFPFHLVDFKGDEVPFEMVDMLDDEILQLWDEC
mmetsp:Transcript_12110/g.24363  ORF Transcript_12110/g.24363 Transcript_12110/m.24363 type:complete len:264 (-) Transcript_12110:103-894(-)